MYNSIADYKPNLIVYNSFDNKEQFRYDFECLDCYVIFICIGGRYEFDIEDIESGIASRGDAVLCPPGCKFSRRVLEPVSLRVIRFDVSDAVEKAKLPVGKLRLDDFDRIIMDLSMLPVSFCRIFKPSEQHYLLDVWYSVIRQAGLLEESEQSYEENPVLNEALRIIEVRYSEKLTVKGIAEELGFTPVAFIRIFKSAYGITPMNFIINRRIRAAESLLVETAKSITEISILCGYENEYYFSNSFKKQTGFSPRAFRKSIQV